LYYTGNFVGDFVGDYARNVDFTRNRAATLYYT